MAKQLAFVPTLVSMQCCASSVPAQRVLCRDGGRDVGGATRVAHAAASAAATVATSGAVVEMFAAEQGAAHQRGAGPSSVSHFRRVLTVGDGV